MEQFSFYVLYSQHRLIHFIRFLSYSFMLTVPQSEIHNYTEKWWAIETHEKFKFSIDCPDVVFDMLTRKISPKTEDSMCFLITLKALRCVFWADFQNRFGGNVCEHYTFHSIMMCIRAGVRLFS